MRAPVPLTRWNHRIVLLTIVLLLLIGDGQGCKSSPFLSNSYQKAVFKHCLVNGYAVMQKSAKDIKFGLRNHLFLRPVRPVPPSKVFNLLYTTKFNKIQFISETLNINSYFSYTFSRPSLLS